MLPQDPFMLLSFINTKLRDDYTGLEDLCASLDIDRKELESRLDKVGFVYMPEINQFR